MTAESARPPVLDVTLTVEQLWQSVPGGSGRYVRELAGALLRRDDLRLRGLVARHPRPPEPQWAPPPNLPLSTSPLPRAALYEMWSRRRRGGRALPGVLHATTWAIPPTRSRPLVVTVHDLAFLRDSAHFTARGNAFFRRALQIVRDEADQVIAVSQTTRDDCVAEDVDPARVHVVPHGVAVPPVRPEQVAQFRARLGLNRPYVLWCGTVEPRKNLPGLLRAFGQIAGEVDVDLVLVGPHGWGDDGAVEQAAAMVPHGRLHRTGEVDEPTLHAAYAGARAFCFPSLWEGFGLPVLEAMAHGLPVVTSAGTATAEAGSTAALLVDPNDPDAIADALLTAVGNQHDRLAALSLARAAGQTWDRCAAATVEVYRRAARS